MEHEHILQLNKNFDSEIPDVMTWLDIHINTLLLELQQIHTAVYIFKTVDEEWNRLVGTNSPPGYSAIRTSLYEALVYRIILGLNKIFSNSKEYSLLKATNQIEQLKLKNESIEKLIKEIRTKREASEMIKIIHEYRNTFYAHLDKQSVHSHFRIEPSAIMNHIDIKEIKEWILLVGNFYNSCFNRKLDTEHELPKKEDILHTFFWQ